MKKASPPKVTPSEEKGWVKAYGLWWPPIRITNPQTKRVELKPRPQILIEQECFMALMGKEGYTKPIKDSDGPKTHFMEFVNLVWNWEGSPIKFLWTPLAVEMLEECLEHRFVAIAGHASSGKSVFGAIWALVNYLMDPNNTKVFVTSTSLEESKQRIWGVIERYWHAATAYFQAHWFPMSGHLISSRGMIRGMLEGKPSQLVGIALLAGGKGQDKKATTKIGFKANRLFLVADELPLLTEEFNAAAIGNLSSNKNIHMIGIGNPLSYHDPFGKFSEPAEGWSSINEHSHFWLTHRGCCIRFDGEQSPNVLARREIWPNLLTYEQVANYKKDLGEDSPEYWRMVRGYWSPTGAINAIYCEREIVDVLADKKITTWVEVPVKLAFLDPAWTLGGDRAVVCFGMCGKYENKAAGRIQKALEYGDFVDLMKKLRVGDDPTKRIIELYKEECDNRKIPVTNRGVDSTGGGTPFASFMAEKMGRGFKEVSFNGKASHRNPSRTDAKDGRKRYHNKVTELWYSGKELIRGGNIKGLSHPDCVTEMCARTYKEVDKETVQVEPKKLMKQRTGGKSPDYADAAFGLLEMAKDICGLASDARAAKVDKPLKRQEDREFSQFTEKKRGTPPKLPQLKGSGPSWGLTGSFKRAQIFGMRVR
jgi:hypothetical protein